MIDATRAFARIEEQYALGPRFVGSAGHAAAQALLDGWLAGADSRHDHQFDESFVGDSVTCRNLVGRFDGTRPGRLLFGTHYDTRPWADEDPDPARHRDPVPGANDGGSGVALLAELAVELAQRRDRMSVDIVLFDAEDWHGVDGKEVSLGARRFVEQLAPEDRPDQVMIFDMLGGRDLMLDVDVNAQGHEGSFNLTVEMFQLGRKLGLPAFELNKEQPYKFIGCDHTPFQLAGIDSAILIDIDYPPWHTVDDTPVHCDPSSLQQIAVWTEAFLFGPP